MPEEEGTHKGLALTIALLAALVFVAVGCIKLGAQGAYYDELHQATAGFSWLGKDVDLFARAKVGGLPLFNMTYSGAIKSHMYGCWMWATDSPYSIESWRWLGLLMGGAAVFLLGCLAGSVINWQKLSLLLMFVVTDVTLLVGCRHDWGPIALAFLLRVVILGLCLRPARAGQRWLPLVLGFLLGVAVYEKLSSAVTVLPILVLFLAPRERREWRACFALLAGGLLGAAPVILWNLQWLLVEGKAASLMQSGEPPLRSFDGFLTLVYGCAVMPQGDQVYRFILGSTTAGWMEMLEASFFAVGLVCSLWASRPRVRLYVFGAVLTVLGLFGLPSRTGVHHWVLLSPWLYLAVVLALSAGSSGRVLRWVVAAWLALRLVTLALLVSVLSTGSASPRWSPEMHHLESVAASCDRGDLFIAADWGVATQVVCAAQGRGELVAECFVNSKLPDLAGMERVFLLGLNPLSDSQPRAFGLLLGQLEAEPNWRRVENPQALRGLRDLQVLTFRRVR